MKKWPLILLVSVVVLGWDASIACAEMYVSGNLGAVWAEDSDVSDGLGNTEISFDPGVCVTVAFGYALDNGLRAEGEIGGHFNEMDEFKDVNGSGTIDGYLSTASLMANVFYNLLPSSAVSPFVGAGVGIANVEADFDDQGHDDDDSENDSVLAYQLAAGVSFALKENLKIDLQYRYFATDDPDFDGIEIDYITHNAMVGVRYSF